MKGPIMWNDALDRIILDGRARGLSNSDVAAEASRACGRTMSREAVRRRLTQLASRRAVDADVDIPITFDEPHERTKELPNVTAKRDNLAELLRVAKRGVDLESLCDKLLCTPRRARELIAEAQAKGYALDLDRAFVGRRPVAPSTEEHRIILPAGQRSIIACLGDPHFGSKTQMLNELIDFVHVAYKRGVRTMLCVGDWLDGVYRHSRWEQTQHGFDEQCDHMVRKLPVLPGLSYVGILGNHDDTFIDHSGMDVGRAMTEMFVAAGRNDFQIIGDRGGMVRLARNEHERGILVELWHGLGGGAYALTYKLQRKIESISLGSKPDLILGGHWHTSAYCVQRGIHAFASGCWQNGFSPFGKALGTTPATGSWIIEYAQTAEGTLREIEPTWVSYYVNETPREMIVAARPDPLSGARSAAADQHEQDMSTGQYADRRTFPPTHPVK